MDWKKIAAVALVGGCSIATMGAAKGCEPGDGKATKASYAGDGVTMFVDATNRACGGNTTFCKDGGSGKLRFSQAYKAVAVDTTDRQNCEWSLYTFNQQGKTKVIKKGNYFNARIIVERPDRVKVYLKSDECGNWKPER